MEYATNPGTGRSHDIIVVASALGVVSQRRRRGRHSCAKQRDFANSPLVSAAYRARSEPCTRSRDH